VFFVVPETECAKCGEGEEYNDELIYFGYEARCVNCYGISEEAEVAGLGEEFYGGDGGDNDNGESREDGDTASEGNDGLAVSVICRF
jgi:hypothetical protein